MSGDVVPFEAMLAMQAREDEDKRLIERTRLTRTLNVPTNDDVVKRRLRACGVPAILFGEDPAQRRDRLKAQGALMLTSTPELARQWHRIMETQKQIEEAARVTKRAPGTVYHTDGGRKLLDARQRIAQFSIERARSRLERARAFRESSHDYVARLRTLKTFHCTGSFVGDTRPLSSLSVHNGLVATSSWSGAATIWDSSGKPVRHLTGAKDRLSDIKLRPGDYSASDLSIATGGVERQINLYDGTATSPAVVLSGHSDRISRLAFHPDGRTLISTSFDLTFRMWDLETKSCVVSQDGNSTALYGLGVHPDGSLVGTGDLGGNGRVWDLRTGRAVIDLVGHIKQVLCVDFAHNGYLVATGSGDNTARIWDLRKKTSVYTLPGHVNMVSDVKFAPHDRFLVTAGYDSTARLWSGRDFSAITSLQGHEDKLTAVAVSADARHLYTASFDRTWKLWSIVEDKNAMDVQ
ncbi:Pre-mRNA processing factor 4 (PRP4)-like domain-containing protein [Plasmodiophora brassicae]